MFLSGRHMVFGRSVHLSSSLPAFVIFTLTISCESTSQHTYFISSQEKIKVRDEGSITTIQKILKFLLWKFVSNLVKEFHKHHLFFIISIWIGWYLFYLSPTLTHFTNSQTSGLRVETRRLQTRQWKRGSRRSAVCH